MDTEHNYRDKNMDTDYVLGELKQRGPRLPLSKVKRIGKVDQDSMITSNMGYIAAAFAAEYFVQTFVEQAMVSTRKKNRTSRLTYDDLLECVRNRDDFVFLEDVIRRKSMDRTSKPKSQHENTQQGDIQDGGQDEVQDEVQDKIQDAKRANMSEEKVDVKKASESARSVLAAFKFDGAVIKDNDIEEDDEVEDKELEDEEEKEIDPEVQTQLEEMAKMDVVEDIQGTENGDTDYDEDEDANDLEGMAYESR